MIHDAKGLLFGFPRRILSSMFGVIHDLLITTLHAQGVPDSLYPGDDVCGGIFSNGGLGAPGSGFTCISAYIQFLTFAVISFAASISLIMLMINGFRYMMGPAVPGGSSDAAKKGISAALTGLALSLLTYVILDTIIRSITN